MVEALYKQVILSHSNDPVGYQKAIQTTHSAEHDNPLCGDRIKVQLQINNDRILDAAFEGEACAICLASTSLLCTHLPGNEVSTIQESMQGFSDALKLAAGETSKCPDYLIPMLGVKQYPARVQCVLLPWEAAQEACRA